MVARPAHPEVCRRQRSGRSQSHFDAVLQELSELQIDDINLSENKTTRPGSMGMPDRGSRSYTQEFISCNNMAL